MLNRKKNILIIGKLPPPIGGVTIHVSRLLERLQSQNEINYFFLSLNLKNLFKVPLLYLKYSCVHIHTSNPLVRFLLILFSNVFFIKSIITFHGDLGRYKSKILNLLDKITVYMAVHPVLLNESSYNTAIKLNKNSLFISSFIPPQVNVETLNEGIEQEILILRANFRAIFCTNAYGLSFDKNNIEIYGIFEILDFFKSNSIDALIISDPSGAYKTEFLKRKISLPKNIFLIGEPHSFYRVISLSDISIRNTSTDGDSISVKESLYLNKRTMCTDVVSRPFGCVLYKRGELKNAILDNYLSLAHGENNSEIEDASVKLFEIYKKF